MSDERTPANRALLIGMIAGALSSFELIGHVELELDNDRNYTGRIFIDRPSGRWALTVEAHDLR